MPVDAARTTPPTLLALAAGLALGLARGADAQTLSWTNASGGSAGLGTNWSPTGVPTGANSLVFNISSALATIPISFPLVADDSLSHTYRQESWTLTMSSPHNVGTGGITIGDLVGDNAAVILTSGTLNSAGAVVVGDAAGSNGALTVNDDDADLIIVGAGADLTLGLNGDASMTIIGGGFVGISDLLFVGSNTSSSPTMIVTGQTLAPIVRSTLAVNGGGVSTFGGGGDATVTIADGALADLAGSLAIANGSFSVSSVTIGGMGVSVGAQLDVAVDLRLSRNTSAGSAAGVSTMTVNADGRLDVGGALFVAGDPDGGTATLTTKAGSTIVAGSLHVGPGGLIDFDGGAIDVDGGTLGYGVSEPGFALGGADNPTFTLRNGASGTLGILASGDPPLIVGGDNDNTPGIAGTLHVLSGSTLDIDFGGIVIGQAMGCDGKLLVGGGGSALTMLSSQSIPVGQNGTGMLEVELGASAALGRVFIGQNPGSDGTVLIESPGSTATANDIFIGGGQAAAGGSGILIVNAGATVDVSTGSLVGITVWPAGALQVQSSGSTLTSDKPIQVKGGSVRLFNGASIIAKGMNLESGSELLVNPSGPGAGVSVLAATSLGGDAVIDMLGNLEIGDAASDSGFSAAGTTSINLHGNELTIHDQNGSGIGQLNLTSPGDPLSPGGTVIADEPLNVFPGSDISGAGTFRCDVNLQSAGSAMAMAGGGITIDGQLTNNSGGPIGGAGTTLTIAVGGGYTGKGTIDARISASVKSIITATGDLTMGANSSTGCTLSGELRCGPHLVTLVDSNGVTLGARTELVNGDLVQPVSLGFGPGSAFQGMGTVDTALFSINGDIKPGDTDGAGVGTGVITATGDIQIGAQTHYFCHLGPGVEFPESDRIRTTQVVDAVQIKGGTLEVQVLPFYTPSAGDIFDVVVGLGGVSGQFAAHVLPPKAGITYLPDRVRVHFCYADCEGDGDLDIFDFLCFQNSFGSGHAGADCELDGDLDIFDFLCFQNEYGVGCKP